MNLKEKKNNIYINTGTSLCLLDSMMFNKYFNFPNLSLSLRYAQKTNELVNPHHVIASHFNNVHLYSVIMNNDSEMKKISYIMLKYSSNLKLISKSSHMSLVQYLLGWV